MLYREVMAVRSEIHTKHKSTLWEQNMELSTDKLAVYVVTTGLQIVKFQLQKPVTYWCIGK
jgi:hypothetical protein